MLDKRSWKERDLSEVFFPVAKRPVYMDLYDGANQRHKLDRHFAIVDLERAKAFAVVTDDYQLITNEEAFGRSAGAMKQVFHATTLEDLACFNITMPKSRSFCHIDLIQRDKDFSPWVGDDWTAFMRITNSYNRTRKLRFELGFCRWICSNGMIFGAKSVELSYAHTRRGMVPVERFTENIGDIRKLELSFVEQLHQLQRFYVPRDLVLAVFCRAFGLKLQATPQAGSPREKKLIAMRNQVEALAEHYFGDMGPHGYAMLNVLTDFATRPKGVISAQSEINGFQQKTSEWMEDFIRELSSPKFLFGQYLADYLPTANLLAAM